MVRRRAWHSEEADGNIDGSRRNKAVYHVCRNCQYLKTIIANKNRKRGKGIGRRRCRRCTDILRASERMDVVTG